MAVCFGYAAFDANELQPIYDVASAYHAGLPSGGVESRDGKRLSLHDGWSFMEIDATNGEILHSVAPGAGATSYDDDGSLIAYAWKGDSLVQRDVASGVAQPVASLGKATVGRMIPANYQSASGTVFVPLPDAHAGRFAWSADRRMLAEATDDGQVDIWNAPAGKVVKTLKFDTSARRIDVSPDGRILAAADEKGSVRLQRLDNDEPPTDLTTTCGVRSGLIFSPDGKLLAAAAAEGIEVWETAGGKKQDVFAVPIAPRTDGVIPSRPVVWSQDSKRLFARRDDNRVQVIDVATGDTVRTIENVSTDGWFVTENHKPLPLYSWHDGNGGVFVADLETGDVHSLFAFEDGTWFAISPDGHYRGRTGVEDKLVYVVQKEDAQELLSPQEFASKHNWKNDPAKVRLTPGIQAEGIEITEQKPEPTKPAEPAQIEFEPEPPHIRPGQPLTELALVRKPSQLPGVVSWSVDTRISRFDQLPMGFSPDGAQFLTVGFAGDDVTVWHSAARQPTRVIKKSWDSFGGLASFWGPNYIVTDQASDFLGIWDAASGALVRRFPKQSFLCNGNTKIVARSGPELQGSNAAFICDIATGAIETVLERNVPFRIARWSPNESHLALAGERDDNWPNSLDPVDIWNERGERIALLYGHSTWWPGGFDWTDEGRFVGVDNPNKAIRIWEVDRLTPPIVKTGTFGFVSAVKCAGDASRMVIAEARNDDTLVDLSSKDLTILQRFSGDETVGPKAISPDGRMILGSDLSRRQLCVWRANNASLFDAIPNAKVEVWPMHGEAFELPWLSTNLALSPVQAHQYALKLARTTEDCAGWTASGKKAYRPNDTIMEVVDVIDCGTGQVTSLDVKRSLLQSQLAGSSDGSLIAISFWEGPTEVWSVESAQVKAKLSDAGGGRGLGWSPDDRHLAARIGTEVVLFNAADGDRLRQISPGLYVGHPWSIKFSSDGRMLAIDDTWTLQLWDVESGTKLKDVVLDPTLDVVRQRITWLADNKHVALRCADGSVRTLNIESGKIVATIPAAFDPRPSYKWTNGMLNQDGSQFISADCGAAARVFDTLTGNHLYSVAWLRDNQWLVVTPDGHFRCSPGVEKLLGYFLLLDDGSQTMLTPAEFEQRFGWKNDPAKVPQLPGM